MEKQISAERSDMRCGTHEASCRRSKKIYERSVEEGAIPGRGLFRPTPLPLTGKGRKRVKEPKEVLMP